MKNKNGENRDKYDVIIIGSGISGLTAASIFSQLYGKKVLLTERHGKIGGFTHTFKRLGKYEWDVGLHYVGGMQKGQMTRAIFDYITAGKVKWSKMPDPYDVFIYPDIIFKLREGENNFKNDLIKLFPDEKKPIIQYFKDMKRVVRRHRRASVAEILPSSLNILAFLLRIPGRKLARSITKDYFDRYFSDEKLKAILASQWGDHGLPPGMSTFFIHSLIVQHYIDGGYFPVGGSRMIAESIVPLIEEKGGTVVTRNNVEKILIENDRAVGISSLEKRGEDHQQRKYFADIIVSAVGVYTTYKKLVDSTQTEHLKNEVANLPPGIANVTLFIGLKNDPDNLGWNGENYWIYDSLDHDKIFERKNDLLKGQAHAVYVSFPSKKNPEAQSHTMEIIAFIDYEPFKKWADQPVKKRDESYQQVKQTITEAMIGLVEKYFPGFKNLIDYAELSTPLTTEHYTGHYQGNIYGIPAVPKRYDLDVINIRSPIKNLYLTGADTSGHGIVGAMMSGVLTTAVIQGVPSHLFKIFGRAKKFSDTLVEPNE